MSSNLWIEERLCILANYELPNESKLYIPLGSANTGCFSEFSGILLVCS